MKMRHYLAYGSNLHPLRLTQRVPSARLIDTVELVGHKVFFHKRGHDRSGKCNLTRTGRAEDRAYGAVYLIAETEKHDLDRIEGIGHGYALADMEVFLRGETHICFTYQAEPSYIEDGIHPYHWYKSLVHLGAAYLDFPATYVQMLSSNPSMDDPDPDRARVHETLVARIQETLSERFLAPSQGNSNR